MIRMFTEWFPTWRRTTIVHTLPVIAAERDASGILAFRRTAEEYLSIAELKHPTNRHNYY